MTVDLYIYFGNEVKVLLGVKKEKTFYINKFLHNLVISYFWLYIADKCKILLALIWSPISSWFFNYKQFF